MFPEIPDIFSKYLAFSPIPNIFLSFFYKYHNNDFIKSKTSFIGKTGMYMRTRSVHDAIATDATTAFAGFLPCLTINGMTFISMGYNVHEEIR